MDYRKIILWFLIIVIGISLMGCRRKKEVGLENDMEIVRSDEYDFQVVEEEGMRKTVLYFKDKQGLLVPLMRKLPWEEGIAKSALNNMIDTSEQRESLSYTGLNPIIPAGTEIRGMAINEETGICKVDFSEGVLNYETEKEEENLIKGVVYTLTEFQSIEEVEFMVNGSSANFKFNTLGQGPFKRENINLAERPGDHNSKVLVYYKGNHFEEDYDYFVPVTIPTLAPVPNIYTALETLFDGPNEELGLSSNIPEGVSFHGADIKDGIAYVDISFDYGEPAQDAEVFSNMVKNIGLTLSEFEELEGVELLIDGKSLTELGMDLYLNKGIPAFANEH